MAAARRVEPELEVWQNAGYSTISLNKFDSRGNIVREQISAKRKVMVSPEERRLNQEVAANDSLDFFQNGMLVPVRLVDSEPDTKALQANVNAMSETAMKALFNSQPEAFRAKLTEISNVTTLNRLIEVASDVDATIRQVEAIQARLAKVSPTLANEVGVQVVGGTALGTKAPRSERDERSMTGRPVSPR